MRNLYIFLFLILIVALGLFFGIKNNKLEAPAILDVNNVKTPNDEVSKEVNKILTPNNTNKPEEMTNSVKEFTITGQNFSFKPNIIKVKKGDKVKITFINSEGFHDFKIDEFNVATPRSESPSTKTVEFVADKIGNFKYYCSVGNHRALGMEGNLIVE